MSAVRYDRAVLVDVLVHHWPTKTSGCECGWGELGRLFPEHVADMYEASIEARSSTVSAERQFYEDLENLRQQQSFADVFIRTKSGAAVYGRIERVTLTTVTLRPSSTPGFSRQSARTVALSAIESMEVK